MSTSSSERWWYLNSWAELMHRDSLIDETIFAPVSTAPYSFLLKSSFFSVLRWYISADNVETQTARGFFLSVRAAPTVWMQKAAPTSQHAWKRLGSPWQTSGWVAELPWCPVTLYHTSCYYLLVRPAAYSVVMSWHSINQEPACVGGSLLRRLTLLCVPAVCTLSTFPKPLNVGASRAPAHLLNHYAISQQPWRGFLCHSGDASMCFIFNVSHCINYDIKILECNQSLCTFIVIFYV